MNIMFDPGRDILQISLKPTAVYETAELSPGIILDYDEDGNVVGIEVRQASKKVDEPAVFHGSVGEIIQNKPHIRDRV